MERRAFVKKAGLGLATVALSPTVSFVAKAFGISEDDAKKLISFQCHLFRPKDLLDLEYSFINVKTDNWVKRSNSKGTITNEEPKVFSKIKYLIPSSSDSIAHSSSYMIVRIAQQHISEQFFDIVGQINPDKYFQEKIKKGVAKSFISGYSFIVFKIRFDEKSKRLDFNSSQLLNWDKKYFELITGNDITDFKNKIQFGDSYPTLIPIANNTITNPITLFELPYKLYLTPKSINLLFKSNELRETKNKTLLWSNKIVEDTESCPSPSFKVIGYEKNSSGKRTDNSNADYLNGEKYLPDEIDRKKLTEQFLREDGHEAETLDFRITPLGAITKIRYNELSSLYIEDDIIEWKQDINIGKDNYVKVVTLGVIMPFGFKCKHIRIGERKIKDGVSFVEYKEFIEPLEFEKTYFTTNTTNEPDKPKEIADIKIPRNTPFQKIKITTKISPPIIPVDEMLNDAKLKAEVIVGKIKDTRYTADPNPDENGRSGAFWPRIGRSVIDKKNDLHEMLHFDYVGIDWNNKEIHFKAPFIFARDILFTQGIVDIAGKGLLDVKKEYEKVENKIRREIDIAGQKIAYYRSRLDGYINEYETKLSELETQTIQFLAYQGAKYINEFPYYPQLEAAYVYLPVVKEIIKDPRGTIIKYAIVYLQNGIEEVSNNIEGILLDVQKEAKDAQGEFIGYAKGQVENVFDNIADKLAGVVKPEMVIQAISLYENAYGMYQGCAEIKDGVKRLKSDVIDQRDQIIDKIFKDAKILGELYLKDLLLKNIPLNKLPKAKINQIPKIVNGVKSIEKIVIDYNWTGDSLFADKDYTNFIHFYSNEQTKVDLNINQVINLKKVDGSFYESSLSVSNFGIGIQLAPKSKIITLYFKRISFLSATNRKQEVDVAISNVEFSGILELVKQLQNSLGTFGKGLSFDIFGDKILVSYQFVVPAISCGAFNLTNLSFGFEFLLYFKNKPLTFNFSLSERNNPALLSIGIFGGRFFGKLGVSSKGLEQIEILIEFGGYLGVNLGVAKGCIYLFAGVYYKKTKDCAEIDGYIVCGGVLNVLGIVSLSLTFYMGVKSGCEGTGELRGYAQVRVSIRITRFFKISRTIGMEKRLSNSGINKYGFIDETSENKDIQKGPDESLFFLSIEDLNFVTEYVNAFK